MKKQPLLLKNAHIVQNNKLSPEKSILINNGIIQQITNDAQTILEKNESHQKINILNAKTYVLTPGLIDNHVHLILNGEKDIITYVNTASVKKFRKQAENHIIRSLSNGITTLRDMGDTAGILAHIKQHQNTISSPFPHLISSGKMLTAKTGHVQTIAKQLTTNTKEIHATVNEQIIQQADFIKLIISGGLLTPGSSPLDTELPLPIIKQVCKQAKQKNVPIAAHVYSNHDILSAINAGVTSIEHGIWAKPETLNYASKKNILFTPTIKAAYDIINHKDLLPAYMVKNAELVISKTPSFIKHAKKQHTPLAMGTDAGTPFNYHGDNAKELQYLNEFGLSENEAIKTGTTYPGKHIPKRITTGLIKQGYCADLLLLTKNPLNDITAFQHNIKYVISKGICINPIKEKEITNKKEQHVL